jgi:hypothetical protein
MLSTPFSSLSLMSLFFLVKEDVRIVMVAVAVAVAVAAEDLFLLAKSLNAISDMTSD